MICRNRKLIFIHIPKCGGTSIEDRLWPPEAGRTAEMLWMGFVGPHHNRRQTGGLQHLTARQVREEVGEALFRDCFKFALCRHPLDRLVSQYKYMSRRPDLRAFAGLSAAYDFDEYLDRTEACEHVQWTPQWRFLLDDNGTLMVDHIYKLEEIAADPRPLLDALGLGAEPLARVNTTDDTPSPSLSPAQRARVYARYRRDFEMLGYR